MGLKCESTLGGERGGGREGKGEAWGGSEEPESRGLRRGRTMMGRGAREETHIVFYSRWNGRGPGCRVLSPGESDLT